ncbi:transglutaminase domain-containing protein [Teredinibacter waterburyi]|uniref:transglutaminase domain-containing protein n=1 Tax=Teredinibacter waterburyi TaxID=1500538 RepID=UPI00165EC17B|nr:transglutaminase family protein [Teredinibacter waterburyi]
MWLRTSCDITFNIDVKTPFLLMLRPRSGAQQWVAKEQYKLVPSVPAFEFTDVYGNLCQRLIAMPPTFAVYTQADVMTADLVDIAPGAAFVEVQNLPDDVLYYLLPSRYCESDRFGEMARSLTAGFSLGYDQVEAITRFVHSTLEYRPGQSYDTISATEVNQRQYGVCRDLSHLCIALCRSLSIPARLVVGYLHELEPMDLHAWFEAFVGNRWYTFDPTEEKLRGGYVAIGYGRDAADVAVYNQFGPAVSPISQKVSVELLNPENY